MPLQIPPPPHPILITPTPLAQSTFSPFGTVIANPQPTLTPSSTLSPSSLPPNAVPANQGSALKYQDVTHMRDLYAQAPSRVSSKAVMNMFVCAPRRLLSVREGRFGSGDNATEKDGGIFPISILERHPYTTQTFIPLGLSPTHAHELQYLVIVAPSLPPSELDSQFPVPDSNSKSNSNLKGEDRTPLPGRGLPDLSRIQAFLAHGGQAVTYAAGTWHAPMVVLGRRPVDFVVVQFANGVGGEDCQEVEFGFEGEQGDEKEHRRIGVLVKGMGIGMGMGMGMGHERRGRAKL
ncbi:Ureidoglycolate lyase [Cadophora gregata]|uniref:Ureidoglycolate lyase n=1 Tax=Cadophora gregata TaxID=51156 RepID=UPI0026DCAAE0|nr:Ureidoglycolate lyase [Cadophora gregata]KAK0101231.1 Ureidoglycolate lyase [Cadophora gregata]KAK0106756.1 Ureidoglycolate lyase [Cadophora gregata f. sp. sojae]